MNKSLVTFLIKKSLVTFLVCTPLWAMAVTPLQLNFDKASIQTFIGTLYGKILQKNFVLSPDVLALNRAVTLNVSLQPEVLGAFIAGFMADQGLSVTDREGVAYIGIKLPPVVPTGAADLAHQPLAASMPDPSTANEPPPTKHESEALPPAFKVFKPTRSTTVSLCEAVNKVFLDSCHATPVAAVLVHPKHLELLSELAAQLDIRPTLIDVSATFIEVSGSKRDGYGFNLVASVLGGSLGMNFGASVDTPTITIKGANLTALLDILRTDGRFKQVASPSGRVTSGSPFNIAIGDEVPTLSGQSRDNTGQITNQVLYRPSGVLLNVQPVAITENDSSLVSTTVDAQVSSFSKTESGVNGSPTLSKRQVKTSLVLSDGEVAVIGGLTGSRSTSSSSSILGLKLTNRDDDTSTDLVLMLSARVVK